MAGSVLIGRKELFAFADRYSSRRLHDYAGLADGEVLCRLFSLVFPQCAIRPASAQTHSLSQRTLIHWEALFRGFARLHIPLALLDPLALARNDADKGFSALVLFYFLFHLTKKTDFSAEFAMDVSEELTAFLQSIDSIASLLLGEAIEWEAIPEELGNLIRGLPSFHVSPSEQRALEEAAAKQCRALLAPPAPATTQTSSSVNGSVTGKARSVAKRTHRLSPPNIAAAASATDPAAESDNAVVASLSSPDRAEGRGSDALPPRQDEPSEAKQSTTEPSEAPDAQRRGQWEEEPSTKTQRRRYVEKAKEVEALRGANIQLLSQVASLEAELDYTRRQQEEAEARADELGAAVRTLTDELEASHQQLRTMVVERDAAEGSSEHASAVADNGGGGVDGGALARNAEKAIDSLLEDVADPNTGKPIDAHELANLLHCALLEHMQDAPINRGQAQSWLWSIVTAYHVLESRLVAAVDVIESLQRRRSDARCTQEDRPPPPPSEQLWETQHAAEHRLRLQHAESEMALRSLAASAATREGTWRALCATLHQAEELSSAAIAVVAESQDERELAALLDEREGCYRAIEELTEELQRQEPFSRETNVSAKVELDSACMAVQHMAQKAVAEKWEMEKQLNKLMARFAAEQQQSPRPGCVAAAQSTERLTTPLPLSQLAASCSRAPSTSGHSAARTQPKTMDPCHKTATADLSRTSSLSPSTSPYGKSLAALLAEATSPYESLVQS